jgi:hypothetical protein
LSCEFSEYFYYDDSSPSCLRWKVNIYAGNKYQILKVSSGDVAGSLSKRDGYWRVWLKRKSYLVHKVIMELNHMHSDVVDHLDGNRSNNRLDNLVQSSVQLNPRNAKQQDNNTSGFTGVKMVETHGGRYRNWVAQVELLDGTRKSKAFSVAKFGYDEGYRLACEHREEMIQQLNLQGAGYSQRHGKELIQ